jgi:hypothetical protein
MCYVKIFVSQFNPDYTYIKHIHFPLVNKSFASYLLHQGGYIQPGLLLVLISKKQASLIFKNHTLQYRYVKALSFFRECWL